MKIITLYNLTDILKKLCISFFYISAFSVNLYANNYAKEIAALTTEQRKVTQNGGTERPFQNKYWDNKAEGIYVDIVSGKALFSSKDKFKSGTGWPSFTKPLEPDNIIELEDNTLAWQKRTEVKSKHAKSHLGHVFKDGPKPTGLRYCINSASLKFIPKDKLKSHGLEKYEKLFQISKK